MHFEVEFTIISGNAGAKDIVQEGENDFIRNWGYYFIVVFMAIFIQGLLENTPVWTTTCNCPFYYMERDDDFMASRYESKYL